MITMFDITTAKKFFTIHDIFDIKKATKGMSADDVFAWLNIKADETGVAEYAQLAATMVIPFNI